MTEIINYMLEINSSITFPVNSLLAIATTGSDSNTDFSVVINNTKLYTTSMT